MSNRVFIGNLAWKSDEDQLAEFLSQNGAEVTDVSIIREKHSNRSKGYGFASFEGEEQAKAAIEEFNGKEHLGRPLHLNIATPREPTQD